MKYQLVKMDGDYRIAPPKWNLWRRTIDAWRGIKYIPADPRNHPDCSEIIEGNDRGSSIVYKRNG